MRKILVLRGGALGDFIVTLPALSLLRTRWPEARIELAGNATAAQLARARGVIDTVHSQHEARWSALFGEHELPSEFSTWLAEFDLVVNYWPDHDGALRRRFPRRAGQSFLSADAMPQRTPAAAHYCEPLRELGLETSDYFFRLAPAALHVNAETVPSPTRRATIAIHPGSGSPRKNWPAENWRRLIAELPQPTTLILGEVEDEPWGDSNFVAAQCQCLINRTLEELVTHLAHCQLFLGHDSGISHLAAACGARCVLLFGPTEPAMWAPPAPSVRVLRRGSDLNSLSFEEVRSAVQAALSDQT